MSDQSLLREFRVDVLSVVSTIVVVVILIAMYRFDLPVFIGLPIVLADIVVTFAVTMLRFRRERQQVAEFAGSVPAATVVVTSAGNNPVVVHPLFFLERRPDGLSFHRVGDLGPRVLLPWSEIRSIESPRGGNGTVVAITLHEGRPLRFSVAPARRVTGAAGDLLAWLRDGSEFPTAYSVADYLLPQTPSGRA